MPTHQHHHHSLFLLLVQEMDAALRALETGDEAKKLSDIEARHSEIVLQHSRLRATVAARTQEVARIGRAIDDVPGRAELVQYERRFVELYEQVRVVAAAPWVLCDRCGRVRSCDTGQRRASCVQVSEKLDETRKYYSTYNALNFKRTHIQKQVCGRLVVVVVGVVMLASVIWRGCGV
jgi:hypothetical protein